MTRTQPTHREFSLACMVLACVAFSVGCSDSRDGKKQPADTLTLTSPVASDTLPADSPIEITWDAANAIGQIVGDVTITFSTDGGSTFSAVGTTNASAGSFLWTPPSNITQARIRIETANGAVVDELSADFTFQTVWFVDANATGIPDGLSWETAVSRIQTAVDLAAAGEVVWVSGATSSTRFSASDSAVVVLKAGVGMFGGFDATESALSQRAVTSGGSVIDGEQATRCVFVSRSNGAVTSTVDGFSIVNGSAGSSGAGLLAARANVLVRGCAFTDNVTNGSGGGVAVTDSSSSVRVIDCEFTTNEARTAGGGLYVSGSASVAITGTTFTRNSTTSTFIGDGGGAAINVTGIVQVTDCTFTDNGAGQNGGGLLTNGATATIEGTTFSSNTAETRGGGAACIGGSFTITASTFSDNRCTGASLFGVVSTTEGLLVLGGGGLYAEGLFSESTVSRTKFLANASSNGAGFLGVSAFSEVTLENCVFAENNAVGLGGAIFSGASSQVTVSFTTASGNTAATGGAFGIMDSTINLVGSSIFFGNSADEIASFDANFPVTVSNSDVEQSGLGGIANLNADPLFVDASARDFQLATGSPAVDAADPTDAPATDHDGNARIGVPDMGAFEQD